MTDERKTLFITGISNGLGNALAHAALADGWRLFAIGRNAPADLAGHERVRFRRLDLRRHEAVFGTLVELLANDRSLDLVILNAGILGTIKDLADTSLGELRAVLDVNVFANKLIFDTLLALGVAIEQLVAISSAAARNGSGGWGAYSMSKACLNLLFRTYAHEHPETHFTCLAPGLVKTALIDSIVALPDDRRYPAVDRVKSALGTPRMQTGEHAARRILAVLPRLREHESGAYVDIREM